MASATEPKPSAPAATREEEQFVDAQIERTRRSLKLVDLTSGMITLVIGVLVFVLAAAILEHWVVPGGWSQGARVVLFVALFLGICWYSWRAFWPLLRQPINPAYAAQTIEQSSPSLKNSLLNLLLLRSRKRQLSRQVYQAIEHQAAQRLSETQLDSVVDRSAILRLGYVLVAVVALCALYRVFSPKDFMASITRVLLPWSEVTVPSRVQILDITPGHTSAARGDQVVISAEVFGLDEDEQARVLYSSADQQIVEQEVFMSALEDGLRFECRLPGGVVRGEGGLQQNLTYWIEAGDARSSRFKVTVFSRPTLVVQRVKYEYPDYTGYPDREETHTGDLHAIEGTVVTLTAIANQPISSAHLDFEADGRLDQLLKAEDQLATVSFPLELRDDRRTPRYQSYVLRYTTPEGRKNELPPKYEIEVTPDYSPEVQLLSPEEESVDVAVDQSVVIEVEARDPDFAVRKVAVLGEVEGQRVLKQILLDKNHTGRFVKQFQMTPGEIGLKVGDIIEYWAAAADNRQPTANIALTKRRKIRVVGPGEGGGQQGEKQPGEGESNEEPGEDDSQSGENGEEGSEEGDEGSSGSDNGQGEQGEQGEDGEGSAGEGGIGQDSEGMADEDSEQQQGQGGGQNGQENPDQEPSQENANEQTGGSQPSDGGGKQEKVSPEGDEDGEAFERMAEHFEQQDEQSQEGEADEQQGEGESVDGENQETQDGHGGAEGRPDTNQNGEANGDDAEQGDTKGGEGQQQDRSSEEEGAEGEPSPDQDGAGKEQGEQSQENDSPSGEMAQEQGEAGAGENPGENDGTSNPQDTKKPGEREEEESDGTMQNDQEAPAEGEDETESDSEGGQGGDKSGGGQEGAGQQADAEGSGAAGENQAADDGSGQAEQPGEGDTTKPGGNQEANGKTGESSQDQPGNGSKQGGQPGDQPANAEQGAGEESSEGGQPGAQPGDQQQPPSDQESSGSSDSSATNGQQPQGGGTGGNSSPPPPAETQPGDEANLEYAKKQTDLILNRIEDQLQKKQVDESMLEKLGWTQDELRRFLDRWKNLKLQADEEGAAADDAQQELHDALRSLGLGRNRQTGFQVKTAKDMFRDLQDAPRIRTPLEFQERLRGYVKGTATAEIEK